MSASLVGSEMCIRDSQPSQRLRHGVARLPVAPIEVLLGPTASAARSPKPVSYTHLTLPTICSV
eukprot:15329020-Alexandrium_andersonii.AAC.1